MNGKRILKPHRIIPQELYVLRDADRQLQSIIEDMASPGYVLVSRQMGKTNLLLNAKRTFQRPLKDVYTYIDLSNSFVSETDCFRNIVDKSIDTHLNILESIKGKIQNIRSEGLPSHLEHLQELRLILNHIEGKFVIILDEIDALTRASFSDKIFSQIRSIYFERDSYPELGKLTYILSGVVEPTEIIRDSKISPFNIGQKIFLDDFSLTEHNIFLIKAQLNLPQDINDRIYYWTNGNPRITYDICSEVEKKITDDGKIELFELDDIIRKLYLTNFDKAPIDHIRELVTNSKTIRDAITIIRYGKGNQINHSTKTRLYLAGIINSDFTSENLGIKNKIIDESLSEEWIKNIEKQSRNINELIRESVAIKDYNSAVNTYINYDDSVDDTLTNPTIYNIGLAYYRLGHFDKAIEQFEKVSFSPEYEKNFYLDNKFLLGESYLNSGKSNKAIDLFNEILNFEQYGKFHLPSILLLGSIFVDLESGQKIDEAIKYFNDILKDKPKLIKDFDLEYADNVFLSAHLYYGIALSKQGKISEAKRQFDLAFELAQPTNKPLILLGFYNIETNLTNRREILNNIVNIIMSERIIPDQNLNTYNNFSSQSLYNVLTEVHLNLNSRFNEFCNYLMVEFGNIKYLDYAEGLYQVGFIANNNKNTKLTRAIFNFLVLHSGFTKLSPEDQYACYSYLLATTDKQAESFDIHAEKFYLFLVSHRKFVLNTFDLTILLGFITTQIESQNFHIANNVIEYLSTTVERSNDSLKSSKLLIEFMQIKTLYFSDLREEAQLRSRSLLNNLNQLTALEIQSNPLLGSIDNVKKELTFYGLNPHSFPREQKVYGDNDNVNVRYTNGQIIKNIRFRKVKNDISSGRCIIL